MTASKLTIQSEKLTGDNNINSLTMCNIKIPLVDMPERFVAEVAALEQKIVVAQSVIATAPAKMQAVMDK